MLFRPLNTKTTLSSAPQRITYRSTERIRKEGDAFRIQREAEAMEFVRQNMSLPVPAIFQVHISEDESPSWLLIACGPFESVSTFHHFLVSPIRDYPGRSWLTTIGSVLQTTI
ncbi:hypothetical protein F5Y19DRAFT_5354 [Xylariaceae sp. FL1651]|nr:hypothetical protein F5Y19DRAFT_5354 [Xylariaceae sp. FL1651]